MREGDDLVAAIDREISRESAIPKLLGLLALAMMMLLTAKVVELI